MRYSRILSSAVSLFFLAIINSHGVSAQGSVAAVPDEGTATAVENTPANHVNFTITNSAADTDHADFFELICSTAGSVSSCTAPSEPVFLEAGEQATVTVLFTTKDAGKGIVTLVAWGTSWRGYDPALFRVTVESAESR